jgi:membrane protein DedA with SNARE-associated domain
VAHHLFIHLSHFFARYGYWTILGATFLENTGIPAPGATLMLFAGFMARTGKLHLEWAVFAAIAGATLGECTGFLIGRLGGEALLERHHRKLFISSHGYERARAIFLKHAGWAIVVARFISGFREIAGILAGVFLMPPSSFMLSNILGAILWSVSMGCLGYFLGKSWRHLFHLFARINVIALMAFAGVIALLVVWSRIHRHPERG